MKAKVFLTSGLIFFCVIFLATCDNFKTINQVVGGGDSLRVAVRVGNGAAAGRAVIEAGDTIELYITWLGFRGSPHKGYTEAAGPWNYMNVIFLSGYHTNPGESRPRFDRGNENWYNPNTPFTRLWNSNPLYDTFNRIELQILAMRIGEHEYPFPKGQNVIYEQGGTFSFDSITLDDTVESFITRLTVAPGILDCWEETGTLGASTVDHEYMRDRNRKPSGYIHDLKSGGQDPYSFITITGEFNKE